MMKYFALFLLIALFVSCTRQNDERLLSAESFLPANPQYADSILRGMSDLASLSDADKALYGILRTYTDNRLGHEVDNDSLIRPSYNYYYDKHIKGELTDTASLRHYAQCCYYLGLYYAACDSTKRSEDLLRTAIKLSENCHDWHTCYLANVRLSNSFLSSDATMALEASKKAYKAYQQIQDDPTNEVLILCKIGGCYAVMEDYETSISYYKQAYRLSDVKGLLISKNQVCMCLANVYWGKEAYGQALLYAKEGILTADSSVLVNSLITLSACYLANDSLDKAKSVLQSILCKESDYMGKYLVMQHLCDVEIKRLHADSLKYYADSASLCLEHMYFDALKQKSDYYSENIKKEKENEQMRIHSERNKWLYIMLTVVLFFLAFFIISRIKYRNKIEREKQLREINDERYKNSILLRDQEAKARQIAERQKEIEHQRALLEQKSVSMKLIQKYLLDRLDGVSTLMDGGERVSISDETWIEIEKYLNMTDDNFMERLRSFHSDFSEEDYRLCMLVRLKIENEMIGKLYNITVSAVKKRKSGLKKNGFKITDPKVDLNQIINEI